MPELARTRDCIVLVKGDAYPVTVSQEMATKGWQGGQAVQWVESDTDEFVVTFSDGFYAGFMLWGSNESSDLYTSSTKNQPYYRFATVGAGGWQISTVSYERYTYASRKSGGPLVPLEYHASDRLVFSLRGYWTTEVTEWLDSGIPEYIARGLNTYYIGFVSQAPSLVNDFYMGIQVSI